MTRPDLDLLLSLVDEFAEAAPGPRKTERYLAALDPETVRSLVQDAKRLELVRLAVKKCRDEEAVAKSYGDLALTRAKGMNAVEAALHSEEVTRGK